jgi:hypothetical protein
VNRARPDTADLAAQIRQQLSAGRTNKILKFLLNVLSATPVVGGVFSATASAWSEAGQEKINKLLFLLQQYTDEKVTEVNGALSLMADPSHIVAGSITFNPNTTEIVATSSISSLMNNSTLDFTINFKRSLQGYVFTYYGSGPVTLEGVTQTVGGMRVRFTEPAPDRVTIAFFEQAAP